MRLNQESFTKVRTFAFAAIAILVLLAYLLAR